MSNFEPNAVIRGFQLTIVGSMFASSKYTNPVAHTRFNVHSNSNEILLDLHGHAKFW